MAHFFRSHSESVPSGNLTYVYDNDGPITLVNCLREMKLTAHAVTQNGESTRIEVVPLDVTRPQDVDAATKVRVQYDANSKRLCIGDPQEPSGGKFEVICTIPRGSKYSHQSTGPFQITGRIKF
jgi:hypothetical protein